MVKKPSVDLDGLQDSPGPELGRDVVLVVVVRDVIWGRLDAADEVRVGLIDPLGQVRELPGEAFPDCPSWK